MTHTQHPLDPAERDHFVREMRELVHELTAVRGREDAARLLAALRDLAALARQEDSSS
jgi:hypothetical protein